ncbi:Ribosomal protein S18 acetylase RimI [Lachnospiraceae bacterium NE2001]|nr:Ribosomal protein S18 acetylase RimI [Lachnospiraceae bacterium NE2001]
MDFKQIRYLEKIAADGHKALEIEEYKDLELRFSKGYTSRANSIRLMSDPIEEIDSEVEEKLAYAEAEYAKRGLPTIFKLTDADKTFSDYLESRGYTVNQPTDVMMLTLNGADYLLKVSENVKNMVNSIVSIPGDVNLGTTPEDWFEPYFEFEEMTDKTQQELCKLVHSNVTIDKTYIKILQEGRVVAVASLATEDGYSLLHNVVVDPTFRGQGLGKKLCYTAISASKSQEADYSYLQVIESNEVALNLYKKLGYEKLYTYWYMKKEK